MYYDGMVTSQQPTEELFAGLGIVAIILIAIGVLIGLVLAIFLIIIPSCKIFKKAGYEWWQALIPVYSSWVETKISGLAWWWFIIFTVISALYGNPNADPNYVITMCLILVSFNYNYNLAKKFKKSNGFAVLCTLLPFVGLPILGYGKAEYKKDVKVDPNGVFSIDK